MITIKNVAVGIIYLIIAAAGVFLAPVSAQQGDGCAMMINIQCSQEALDGCNNGCTNYDQIYDACQARLRAQEGATCPYQPTVAGMRKIGGTTKKGARK